jgi:hypothetical protein
MRLGTSKCLPVWLIYQGGETTLPAYATRGVKRHLASMGLKRHQSDGDGKVFNFPVEQLDEAAAILKPRRPGSHCGLYRADADR